MLTDNPNTKKRKQDTKRKTRVAKFLAMVWQTTNKSA